ncbi:hypothetical protein [Duganella sp. BuS-21]
MTITLIVTDAGPLITLAVADALDTLKLLLRAHHYSRHGAF